MLLGVDFLGTVPGWLTLGVLMATLFTLKRGGVPGAVGELSDANQALADALKRERGKAEQLGGEVRDLRVELAELVGRTDFAGALAAALGPILEWTAGHEQRAQERHESSMAAVNRNTDAMVNVLELVARTFGPDPDHPSRGAHGEAAE